MTKKIAILGRGLIASNLILLFWIGSSLAQSRVNISNIQNDVRFHVWGNWVRITDLPSSRQYLREKEWTQNVADNSRVNMRVSPQEVLYIQGASTSSQFQLPQTQECRFQMAEGRAIHLHSRNVSTKTCTVETNQALIIPEGTALFITTNNDGTYVGVLSNSATVVGQIRRTEELIEEVDRETVTAGQLAFVTPGGEVALLGEFSLRTFYNNNSLAKGLGPDDEAYIEQQPNDIRKIMIEVQKETEAALIEQEKRPFIDDEIYTIGEIFDIPPFEEEGITDDIPTQTPIDQIEQQPIIDQIEQQTVIDQIEQQTVIDQIEQQTVIDQIEQQSIIDQIEQQ